MIDSRALLGEDSSKFGLLDSFRAHYPTDKDASRWKVDACPKLPKLPGRYGNIKGGPPRCPVRRESCSCGDGVQIVVSAVSAPPCRPRRRESYTFVASDDKYDKHVLEIEE